jgi:hypothetical protein
MLEANNADDDDDNLLKSLQNCLTMILFFFGLINSL